MVFLFDLIDTMPVTDTGQICEQIEQIEEVASVEIFQSDLLLPSPLFSIEVKLRFEEVDVDDQEKAFICAQIEDVIRRTELQDIEVVFLQKIN